MGSGGNLESIWQAVVLTQDHDLDLEKDIDSFLRLVVADTMSLPSLTIQGST